MNLSLIWGQIVTGAVAGAGYAVVAVGLSYTLGLARVMNFAFGSFYMLAAFCTAYLISEFAAPYYLAAVLAVLVLVAFAWVFGVVIVRPALPISEAAVMIVTLGASVIFTNLAQAAFGANVAFIPTDLMMQTHRLGSSRVTSQALLVLACAPLFTAALHLFMHRTKPGMRIRAVAEAPDLASASGLNVPAIQIAAVVIGVFLASIAAVLYAPVGVITVFMGDEALLKAFAIAALAGIGRIWGALFASLAIGIFESLFGAFVSTSYSTAAIYIVLVLTLIYYPRGIFSGH